MGPDGKGAQFTLSFARCAENAAVNNVIPSLSLSDGGCEEMRTDQRHSSLSLLIQGEVANSSSPT